MIVGRSALEKSDRMTWHSEWILCHEKFSKKFVRAFSSWNWTWEGLELVEGEEDAAPEQRGFLDEVDLYLGAIEQTNRRKQREREKQTEEYQA